MSGTGDGRWFSFIAISADSTRVLQLDKATGATGAELDSFDLTGFPLTIAFAMAFWGGDFYLLTHTDPNAMDTNGVSKVTRLDWDESEGNGKSLTEVATAPILVAGAGVSTCAPFVPPG